MNDPQNKVDGQGETGKVKGLRRPRPCPVCDKPSTKEAYPFCSQRCKDVDLSRWLTGAYAIPASEEDIPDEADLDSLLDDEARG